MRRALLLVPGTAFVLTVVAVVRYFRSRGQEQLTDETVRRIRSDAEMSARVAEVDEIPRGKRTVLDGCTVECPTGAAHFDETCARREYPELSHLIGGLARYFNGGIMPGHFLSAVLMNDLQEATSRADMQTFAVLPRLMKLLYNHTPSVAHGSRDNINSWRKRLREEAGA